MLKDIIPMRYRRQVYAVVTLAALVFGAWQASNGNWTEFVASLLTSLTTGLATANSGPPDTEGGAVNFGPVMSILVGVLVILAILWLLGVHVRVG
jgi:hypothetical protein